MEWQWYYYRSFAVCSSVQWSRLHVSAVVYHAAVIAGVLEVECDTPDDVLSYLERGSTYRHTGLTRMNDQSSRSHSVFTLVIGQLFLVLLFFILFYLSLSTTFCHPPCRVTLQLIGKHGTDTWPRSRHRRGWHWRLWVFTRATLC